MEKFKVGDKVRCIDASKLPMGEDFYLTSGEVYKVIKENKRSYKIIANNGMQVWYNKERFEVIKEDKMFNWDRFKNGEIVVHCDTEEKAKDFLEECDKQGIKWSHGDKSTLRTNYEVYNDATCYHAGKGELTYCDVSYFKSKGIEIIKWEIKEMKELTFREVIADIKEGEVWECEKINRQIIKSYDGAIEIRKIDGGTMKNVVGLIFIDEKYKLQRKQYTFHEAFKAYEEGKEIESAISRIKYKKYDKDVSMFKMEGKEEFSGINNDNAIFSINEIRGKWYIND